LLTPASFATATGAFEEERRIERDHSRAISPSRTLELELKRRDGSTVWTEVVAVVMRDEYFRPTGILGIARDISERKKAREELREAYEKEKQLREQLEVEMKSRVEFTRALTHELRIPLTSILASSDMLITQLHEEPVASLAKNINWGATNLNSRIEELLDLARLETGMLELKVDSVDLVQLLHETASRMAPVAETQGQTLNISVPPILPQVQGDAPRLQQVVLNLLDNAIKFTPRGGKISLHAREVDSSVVVEVQDTGRGLPDRELSRLFEPYYRLQRGFGRQGGLGLGLALCKTLVELHSGAIWAKSQLGKGSIFGFSLPLQRAAEEVAESRDESKLWRILIIEDDQAIVDTISLAFQIHWPEAQLVSTRLGEEGIEAVENEAPDIVILDLGLPDMDGFEVLRQVRLFSSVPVIVLTVKTDEADVIKGLELGADDYMAKPFRQMELLSRLKVQLRKQTQPDEETPIVCGPLRFEPTTSQLTYGARDISLTTIEGRIIQHLMRNSGHIVTHSRLAEAVWGEDYPGAIHSLRVNIQRLRSKVEQDPSNPTLIVTKPGIGYSLAKPA
jgi:two-component system KDP operon response regulator KdpE